MKQSQVTEASFGENRCNISSPVELSIVIPAHNEEKYLPLTLSSLSRAVSELDLSAEIVVVNDASTDRTSEIAAECRCRLVDVDLRNIGAVRNAGASVSNGKYLLFVDADTHVPVETLRQTITLLRSGIIGGGALVDAEKIETFPLIKRMMYRALSTVWQHWGGWAGGCYMFCTKEAFLDFKGFDEKYFAAEEYFFSRNLKRRGKFVLVREPVLTSSRKLAAYSSWQLMKMLASPIVTGGGLRSRKGLGILYDGKR